MSTRIRGEQISKEDLIKGLLSPGLDWGDDVNTASMKAIKELVERSCKVRPLPTSPVPNIWELEEGVYLCAVYSNCNYKRTGTFGFSGILFVLGLPGLQTYKRYFGFRATMYNKAVSEIVVGLSSRNSGSYNSIPLEHPEVDIMDIRR